MASLRLAIRQIQGTKEGVHAEEAAAGEDKVVLLDILKLIPDLAAFD
jgi:hypothetical protein